MVEIRPLETHQKDLLS